MSDLVGNHIVGFPTRWLKCKYTYISNFLYLDFFKEEHGFHKRVVHEAPLSAAVLYKLGGVGTGGGVSTNKLTVVWH